MAVDQTADGTVSRHARVLDALLSTYMSSFAVRETTGSATGLVKFRDSYAVPAVSSLVDGAAGNSTAGVHYAGLTAVTQYGESIIGGATPGTFPNVNSAGSKHITITFAQEAATVGFPPHEFAGFNVYVTKAGAPAAGTTPTRTQWFLIVANPSTTQAAAMANISLPQTSITVASTTGFASAGRILITTSFGVEVVAYTSVDATHFLGCTGGRGLMSSGGAVTQPTIPDGTTLTFDWNVADGSLTATNPPATDTSGVRLDEVPLAAGQGVADNYANAKAMRGGGGLYVEVNSGTVSWEVSGA